MWDIYRKRFVFMQIVILVVCAVMKFYFQRSWPQVIAVFVVMEIFNVFGAWWGHRLAQRLASLNERLPLQKK
jgi:hypothetical protein